jgi:hypothetical protein
LELVVVEVDPLVSLVPTVQILFLVLLPVLVGVVELEVKMFPTVKLDEQVVLLAVVLVLIIARVITDQLQAVLEPHHLSKEITVGMVLVLLEAPAAAAVEPGQ